MRGRFAACLQAPTHVYTSLGSAGHTVGQTVELLRAVVLLNEKGVWVSECVCHTVVVGGGHSAL
jgi:hypothetical protein